MFYLESFSQCLYIRMVCHIGSNGQNLLFTTARTNHGIDTRTTTIIGIMEGLI